MGYHFLLQGIFPTGGSNPRLLFGRRILYCWATIQPPALGTWSLSHWTTREVPACTILIPWLGLISLQSNGLSRIFCNITVQKHHFREWDVAFYWLGLNTFTAEGSMPSQGQKKNKDFQYVLFIAVLHSLQDLNSLTREGTHSPAVKVQSLNYWTTREVPIFFSCRV